MVKKFFVGVDVGGTNIKFGLVNHLGQVVCQSCCSTAPLVAHKEKLIETVLTEIEKIIELNRLNKKNVAGIGIGLPGLVNPLKGIVHVLPNIPGWNDVSLTKLIEKKLKISTFIDNDVKLITLAEWKYGAGRGCDHCVCLTLGTGVGSGLILNNQLYRGASFMAGELGHIPLNEDGPSCNCGGQACFERYVGNKSLILLAQKIFKRQDVTLEQLDQMATDGNRQAILFWEQVATHIGIAMVTVVNLLNPQRIIFGGGVSKAHRHIFPTVKKVILSRAFKIPAKTVKLCSAVLGDKAGILGAQVLVSQRL